MIITEHSIKQSNLPGRLILDYETTNDLGRVDCLWLDPHQHLVVGLTSKEGMLGRHHHMFPWSCIRKVGKDSILVDGQIDETKIEKPEGVAPIVGHELWTDEGSKVGHIVDYLIDPDTGAVVSYLFKSKGWSGLMEGVYHLSPSSVESIGNKRLIVQADAIRQSEPYEEGLEKSISAAQEFIKDDFTKTKDDVAAVTEQGHTLLENVKDTTQSVVGHIKERVSHIGRSSKEE
jgi:uncharacterized protein YrrD